MNDDHLELDELRKGFAKEHLIRFHELFEFAPDGQVVTDGVGVIERANLAASSLLGCSKEFLVGKPLGLFVAPGYRRRFYESLVRLLGTTGTDEFESKAGRRSVPRDVVIRVSPLEPGPGSPVRYLWQLLDISGRRRAEAVRDDLLKRLVSAQEDERRRVARELHDSVGQLQVALLLGLRAVRDSAPLPPAALAQLDEVQKVAEELGRATHDMAIRLRPTVLDDVGLYAALQHDLHEWSTRTGVEVQFQAVGMESNRFPPEIETALYRVIQEALTNILKHAGARLVSVVVEKRGAEAIALVEDNGVGFDPNGPVPSGKLGLLGMRERLEMLDGDLELESSLGAGTCLIARLPLKAATLNVPASVPPFSQNTP